MIERGEFFEHAQVHGNRYGTAISTVNRAIEAGDTTTGITIMQMDAGLDTGPMLLRAETAIRADDSTASLHDRLASQGAGLVLQALADRLAEAFAEWMAQRARIAPKSMKAPASRAAFTSACSSRSRCVAAGALRWR